MSFTIISIRTKHLRNALRILKKIGLVTNHVNVWPPLGINFRNLCIPTFVETLLCVISDKMKERIKLLGVFNLLRLQFFIQELLTAEPRRAEIKKRKDSLLPVRVSMQWNSTDCWLTP
jgi:hypothetical protein